MADVREEFRLANGTYIPIPIRRRVMTAAYYRYFVTAAVRHDKEKEDRYV